MRRVVTTLLGFILLISFAGCGMLVSNDYVAKAVEKQGYRDVEVISKHIFFVTWRGCSNDDKAAFKVRATNASGQRVDLTVCAGWPFKGVTVRT